MKKKAINLSVVDINKIAISNNVKGNNETNKHSIGCLDNINGVVPLCIILPQMCGYSDGGGKNMLFKIEDDSVYIKCNQIWNKSKELLGVRFYSKPIYDDSYIKTEVKAFSNIIKTLFTGDEIPKEKIE